jgi:CHASE1-domain containing sensor protein
MEQDKRDNQHQNSEDIVSLALVGLIISLIFVVIDNLFN